MIVLLITFLLGMLVVFYFYTRNKYQTLQLAGVKVPPYHPILGHFYHLILHQERWEYVDKMYKKYKEEPYWGSYEFLSSEIFLRDRDLIRDVMVKDALHFVDRRDVPFNGEGASGDSLFVEMLLHSKGENWKNLRSLISPTFSSGKIKAMFNSISEQVDKTLHSLNNKLKTSPVIEMRQILGQYTLSVIAICAFGMDLPIGSDNEFGRHTEKLSTFGFLAMIKMLLLSILPKRLSCMLGIGLVDDAIVDYFSGIVGTTIESRNKKLIRREDFLDLLEDCFKESQQNDDVKYKMTRKSVIAQSVLFLIAGYDTTSNALSCTCFLLAKNQEKQNKLREDLKRIHEKDGKFTYENISEAEYLEASFAESLRMYGPAHFSERKCTSDYTFSKTGLTIKSGTLVAIPNWSLHYDEEYWPNSREYIPERFLPQNRDQIQPYSYLPFGSGPRNCIGMRFAQLEAKLLLAKLVLKYKLVLPEGRDKLLFNSEPFVLRTTQHGVPIHLEKV